MAIAAWNSITEADLRALAGERSFRRGLGYLDSVGDLVVTGDQVRAAVRGTSDYRVTIALDSNGGIRGTCDCPQGREGFFCKHCVAVGLTMARNRPFVPAQRTGGGGGGLDPWLRSLSRDELLGLIREQLVQDEGWQRRLELRAAAAAADLPGVLARLAGVLSIDGFTAYGYLEEADSLRYSTRVREVAAIVGDLTAVGHGREAVAVAERAIAAVAVSCRNARDPSGAVGDAAADLVASHLAACQAAPPDPAALAGFVAGRIGSADRLPVIEVGWYAGLLGQAGLAELRERCMACWQANPSGQTEQHALEQVLRVAGDVDALAAVIAAGAGPGGVAQLRAARELDRAGRREEALKLAERGLPAAGVADPDLADYLVGRYWSLGRVHDAERIRRDQFAAARDLAAFQHLRAAAERAGTWPATRDWALGLLRGDAAAGRPGPVLIDVLIAEGDLDAAWRAAAGVATQAQWLRLADLVAAARPADALAVYLRQIERLRGQSGDLGYERMARLLAAARECHRRLGTQPAFDSYLRALKADQKRKPRLMAILGRHDL